MAQQQLDPNSNRPPATARRGRWVLGAAVVLAVAVACGAIAWAHSRLSTRGAASTSPVIIFHESDVEFAAIIGGSVLALHHGCLFFAGRPIAWPAGSTWDAEAKVVTVPTDEGGTRRIQVGEPLPEVGGGEIPLEVLKGIEPTYEALSRCARFADPGTRVAIVSAAR